MKNAFYKIIWIISGAILLWACGSSETTEELSCLNSDLSIAVGTSTNPGCNQSNGSISVVATGGAGNYTYSISGGSFVTETTFGNLTAGSYTIRVRDGNDCEATVQTTLSSGGNITVAAVAGEAGCNTSNGTVTVTASGGQAPYTYRINQNSFQSNNVFSSLTTGSYTVSVRDNNGCEASTSVNVLSGLSLANQIKPIIEANCAIAGCHVGSGLPDFRNSAVIISNAANIRAKTQDRSMPPTGSGRELTASQIQQIACWVNDGAPNN